MTNLKINKVMTVEELLMPRYKVIADYPSSPYYVGEIKDRLGDNVAAHFAKYPHLFRKLNWWEERTLDEMMSVNYVRITIYTGYWRVGDVVKVTDYKIDTKNKKLLLYILDASHQSLPERCEPATLDEYKADEIKRKTC